MGQINTSRLSLTTRFLHNSFNLILNEPAGRIAQIIVEHTVKSIVKAWEDTSINPDAVASEGKPTGRSNIAPNKLTIRFPV